MGHGHEQLDGKVRSGRMFVWEGKDVYDRDDAWLLHV